MLYSACSFFNKKTRPNLRREFSDVKCSVRSENSMYVRIAVAACCLIRLMIPADGADAASCACAAACCIIGCCMRSECMICMCTRRTARDGVHQLIHSQEDSRPAAGRRGGVGGRQLQQVYGRDNPCALPSSAGTAVLGGIDAMWPSLAPLLLLGCCRAAARARARARALARPSARAAPSEGCQRPVFSHTARSHMLQVLP